MSVISTPPQLYGLFQVSFVIPEPYSLPVSIKQAALNINQFKNRLNFAHHALALLACLLLGHVPAAERISSQDQT